MQYLKAYIEMRFIKYYKLSVTNNELRFWTDYKLYFRLFRTEVMPTCRSMSM